MYHQFKQLADIDITEQPMEVGPTTHYVMGGIAVDADTQMSSVEGLFAAGECAAGINGANRLGGNSLSDLLVFGKRAGEFAAKFAKDHDVGRIHDDLVDAAARKALAPFERSGGENPYQIQSELQETMQELVGIVRREDEMQRALVAIEGYRRRESDVSVSGNREYNPAWHAALDLANLLTVSEAVARSAIERKESRGAHADESDIQDLAWKLVERGVCRLLDRSRRGNGCPRRRSPGSGAVGRRPRDAVELQSRQVRIVLGRDKWNAQAHVHDATEPGAPR
jgi:succinate dehydrogenase / fumarate reductase flavoprotein subunit